MKITLSKFFYNVLCNVPVCFSLCLTAMMISGSIDWIIFTMNFFFSFTIAMYVGLYFPLIKIGAKFTSLFKIKTDTYYHNIPYRILSTLAISFIFYITINPVICFYNVIILFDQDIYSFLYSLAINILPMLVIGFLTSLISDLPAYKISTKIDK
ncbi:MAG: hypothetical protein RSE56_02650 [Bacilli bacterium]